VGKKKLIVIWPYRFRDFDWQRFELDFLAPHVEIHVHELIDALTHKVKLQGFSESNGELVERFYCVAAPVTDRSGKVVAAFSSTVPKRYLSEKIVSKDRMQECVQDEARQVSEEFWAYS